MKTNTKAEPKTKELIALRLKHDAYIASIYDEKEGIFTEQKFLYYTKAEIKAKLRAEGVRVPANIR